MEEQVVNQEVQKEVQRKKVNRRMRQNIRVTITLIIILALLVGIFLLFDKVIINYMTKPEIVLNGEAAETIDVYAEYSDPGATATIRGKDATDKIVVNGAVDTQVPGKYEIQYKLKNDKGKREQIVVRTVSVVDSEAPVIEIEGAAEIKIKKDVEYAEAGAYATDNVDGDISANIEIEGTVDVSTLGDYELIYRISDSSGNVSETKRIVHVTEKLPDGKTVYLTLDDGPSKITNEILDTLLKYNAKVTFFVIGSELDKYSDVVKRAHDEGHTIALHSNTHNYGTIYASDEAFWEDIDKLSGRVEAIIGEKPMILRFPGGASNTVSKKYSTGIMGRLVDQAHSKGYAIYDWNISSGDADSKPQSASDISNRVIKGIKKELVPAIALMHDAAAKQTTADAIIEIVKWGTENGYTFEAMDTSVPEVIQPINNK